MKRWGLLGLAVLLVLAIAACGKKDAGAGGKVYKFATDAAYSPMEMMDKDKIVGFDADFLDAVMKEAELDYTLTNTGWDPMLISVKDGKEYDGGISSVSITEDRKKDYDYSIPYFESTNMIMSKKDSGVKSALDIKDKKVAVQTGTTADIIMSELMGKNNGNLKRFDNNTLAFMDMDKGGVDAVVADIAIVREYLKQNPNKNYEGTLDPEHFSSEFYGILLPKGSELKAKLDPAIKKVLENGKYVEIYKKWMGEEPNVQNVLNAKA
ncbi:transporter substrate-binding domain-containing protein [Cohnella pontilimi]|uniref:Transporter substrate-binding domain-containing protein n=1 Tax=Cohnella pontilimi TaxID=2564100 RepID=A0A4U0F4X6_9BACL|nr:transporter substrate-binding domain-containing protein [Cohnella pontilimi]TJY38924.1 transporter substrate-binding domain-containing protein [Cohnella pontilimi]